MICSFLYLVALCAEFNSAMQHDTFPQNGNSFGNVSATFRFSA